MAKMVKVELLIARASADGAQLRGDVVDVSSDEAKRLIEAGDARPVAGTAKPERRRDTSND